MSIYRRFAKDIGIVTVSTALVKLKQIIFLPILTAFLSVSNYGVYATLLVTTDFLTPFSSLGAGFGIIRLLSSEKDMKKISRAIFSISLFTLLFSLLLTAIIFLSAGFLADTVFGDPSSTLAIQIGSLLIPLQALSDNANYFFIMRQKMLVASALNLLGVFLPLVFGTVVLLSSGGFIGFLWAFVIAMSVVAVASFIAIVYEVGVSLPDLCTVHPYLKFGMPMVAGSFSGTVLNVGDRYVIGAMMGAMFVGVYSVAYTIGNTVVAILGPINAALLSPASKSYDENRHHEAQKLINYSIRYFLMFAIPAAVGLTILSPALTNTLATSQFLKGAFGVTALVAVAGIFYALFALDTTILYLTKRVHLTSLFLMVAGAVNIALNILLIPLFGLLGAALATLICFVGLFITSSLFSRKMITLSYDPKFVIKSIVAALLMGSVVYLSSPHGWLRLILTTIIGVMVYFSLLILMRGLTKRELQLFFAALRKKSSIRLQTRNLYNS